MKAYYYTAYEAALKEFPPGYFKLAGFETTRHPEEADCFVLPTDIRHVRDDNFRCLPYLGGNEHKHVFFSLSEFPHRPIPIKGALGFRTDQSAYLMRENPRVLPWCWGVEDLERYVPIPNSGYDFDIHAQMWESSPMTTRAVASCEAAGLRVHKQLNNFFYGTLETEQDKRLPELRRTFLETMQRSRLVLVPRSRPGVNRYRFFEAMSMGRVPVLIGDDVMLPFPNSQTWKRCVLRVPEAEVDELGTLIKKYLATMDHRQLRRSGLYGRKFWHHCFRNERWESVWGHSIANALALEAANVP